MRRSSITAPTTMSGVDSTGCCGAAYRAKLDSPAQHVGRYVQTIRQSIGTDASGKALPQPQLWAACLEYRDTTGRPSSWASNSLTVEMDWFGNGPDDGNLRQIQSLVIGQHNTTGTPVEVFDSLSASIWPVVRAGTHIGSSASMCRFPLPSSTPQVPSKCPVQRPYAWQRDMRSPLNPPRPSACPMTAPRTRFAGTRGHCPMSSARASRLAGRMYAAAIPRLRISWPATLSFLVGNVSPYTITLPAASTVPAGTGFTLSELGMAAVTIATSGSDTIDNGPSRCAQTTATTSFPTRTRPGARCSGRTPSIHTFPHHLSCLPTPWRCCQRRLARGRRPSSAMVGSPAKAPAQARASRPSMTGSIGYRSAAVQRSLHESIVLPP